MMKQKTMDSHLNSLFLIYSSLEKLLRSFFLNMNHIPYFDINGDLMHFMNNDVRKFKILLPLFFRYMLFWIFYIPDDIDNRV